MPDPFPKRSNVLSSMPAFGGFILEIGANHASLRLRTPTKAFSTGSSIPASLQAFAKPLKVDARDLPAFAAELLQVMAPRRSPLVPAEDSLVAAVHLRLLSAVRVDPNPRPATSLNVCTLR